MINYISDAELERHYSKDYWGSGADYFEPPEEEEEEEDEQRNTED